jgi:hypothetical protein
MALGYTWADGDTSTTLLSNGELANIPSIWGMGSCLWLPPPNGRLRPLQVAALDAR